MSYLRHKSDTCDVSLTYSDRTGDLRRPLKIEGGCFGLRATSARIERQAYPVHLHFNSPPLTLYSPALSVGAGKSGVEWGEWKVRRRGPKVVAGR
jgi:hypothetical protein